MHIPRILILGALVWAFTHTAFAAAKDKSAPTQVEADKVAHDDITGRSIFTGNVLIKKGSMLLRAERVELLQDALGYQFFQATAAPQKLAYFKEDRELPGEWIEAQSEVMEYDGKKDEIHLFTRALLRRWQGKKLQDRFSGDKLIYNNMTELFALDGRTPANAGAASSAADTRVKIVIAPKVTTTPAAPPKTVKITNPASNKTGREKTKSPTSDKLYSAYSTRSEKMSLTLKSDLEKRARIAQAAAAGKSNTNLSAGLLEVQHLQKSYAGRKVVKDVSLQVRQGEVVGLLGPNGAGKTTSFYMIVGLVRPDGGTIQIDGHPAERMPMHRRSRLGLSYLPQEASIFRKLTVAENIRAVLELQKTEDGTYLGKGEIESRLNGLLDELRVTHLRDSPAPSLSGGERRRVEIARALATNPRYILLDEPFAGIDPIAVIEIQRIINFLKGRGLGVLITDHSVRETLGICDHAYIINEGQVLATGQPEQIVANADVRRVYLGENFRL